LNGNVEVTYVFYHQMTGGTGIYTETQTVTANNGLFSSVVGPSSITSGMTPEDLARPLYMELIVANGVYTETLSPRQRLYGAPYAFTLMPGTVISQTFSTSGAGAGNIQGVVTIVNSFDQTSTEPALPALKLVGDNALMLKGAGSNSMGTISSDADNIHSDLEFTSLDDVYLILDADENSSGYFNIQNGPNTSRCQFNESGDFGCTGTKSAIVVINQEPRKLFAVESPEVWFEDFGAGTLEAGVTTVTIDPLFAASTNLNVNYLVFLTPLGECNGLYVTNKTPTTFEVRELGGGAASVGFDYRIIAKRLGYESERFPPPDSAITEED